MYNHHCHCGIPNGYRHPGPQPKKHRFIDTVKVEKFTVNQVGENCIEKCCEPMPVGVSIKKSCLILSGVTECISRDTYYTFDLDRSVPIDFNALQVFIKAEPCGFCPGSVELEETEIIVPQCEFPIVKFTDENLKKFYQAKYLHNDECCHEHHRVEEFIEVDLDLRGNIATSGYFLRNRYGFAPEYGPQHKYVLYMNNAGRLVLTRNICTTRKYGDFDL